MFCEKCGFKMDSDAKFCEGCGAPAGGEVSAPPYPVTPPQVQPSYVPPQQYGYIPPEAMPPNNYHPQPKQNRGLIIALCAVIVVISIVAVYLFLSKDKPPIENPVGNQSGNQPGTAQESDPPESPVGNQPGNQPGTASVDSGGETNKNNWTNQVERPTADDFDWFLGGAYKQGQPDGVTGLNSFDAIRGEWKGILLFDPDHILYDLNGFVTAVVTISGSANALHLKWAYCDMYEDGVTEDMSGDSSEYEGIFDSDGGLSTGEMADYLNIKFFWEKNGRQYAIGFNTMQSGKEVYVGLVRP